MALFAAEPARAVGIQSLRGNFGGLFVGMVVFTLLGVLTRHRGLLVIPLVFLVLIFAGRALSLAVDDLPWSRAVRWRPRPSSCSC